MKTAVIFLATGIILSTIFLSASAVQFSGGTVDFHLHDTIYVVPILLFLLVVLLFWSTLFLTGAAIANKGSRKFLWPLLGFILFDLAVIVWLSIP